MASGNITGWFRRPSTVGALVIALAGLALWWLPLGGGIEKLSFDLMTVFSGTRDFPEAVLIEMDEPSHDELKQDRGRDWDRRLHARLVNYLHAEGAKTIVFDVEFFEQGNDATATAELAAALRSHGRVVLAAHLAYVGKPGFEVTQIRRPLPELLVPGVTWGVSWNPLGARGEEDGIVRRHPRGRDPDPSLPWMGATAVDAPVTKGGARHDAERWVRHYGPFGTLRRVSYWQATNEAAGFYRGKTVFIGGRPGTGFVGQVGDQFRTPWSRFQGSMVSGLELNATAWLNLVRGDWLHRAPAGTEALAVILFGALLGGVVASGPWSRGFLSGGLAFTLAFGAGLWLFRAQGLWCNWAVAAFVQVPLALGWRAITGYRALHQEKKWLEAPLADLTPGSSLGSEWEESRPANAASPGTGAPLVPEYDLLHCVGRGAYGEVWLARDVLGGFRAVKIVRRVAFDDDGPYEREFRGLQKFAPVSREHPGVVQVLHVGLNRPGNFFYYVMEAGDDERTAQRIEPDSYAPRNLARDLRHRGRLGAAQTADLGIALGDALEFLHQRGLIHRDIKPANVIFVAGQPKLADVGLITDLAGSAHRVSQVGTEGFVPPEGAGAVTGDVFALGRLLHEALRDDDAASREAEVMLSLRDIIARAHADDRAARFQSARALAEALRAWRNKYLPPA